MCIFVVVFLQLERKEKKDKKEHKQGRPSPLSIARAQYEPETERKDTPHHRMSIPDSVPDFVRAVAARPGSAPLMGRNRSFPSFPADPHTATLQSSMPRLVAQSIQSLPGAPAYPALPFHMTPHDLLTGDPETVEKELKEFKEHQEKRQKKAAKENLELSSVRRCTGHFGQWVQNLGGRDPGLDYDALLAQIPDFVHGNTTAFKQYVAIVLYLLSLFLPRTDTCGKIKKTFMWHSMANPSRPISRSSKKDEDDPKKMTLLWCHKTASTP